VRIATSLREVVVAQLTAVGPGAAALCLLWGTAAGAGEIIISASGTSFEGGPAFTVRLGDQEVGSGQVEADQPPDTPAPFRFEVADEVLRANGELSVAFTNDEYGGPGRDRNLYIYGATVGGTELSPQDFQFERGGETQEAEADASFVELIIEGDEARAAARAEGWLPVPCEGEVAVTGFASGAVALTPEQEAALAPILAAGAGDCSVVIAGYASVTGSPEFNLQIAEARARSVLEALVAGGASFAESRVVALGGTEEFGPDEEANRRVVVRVE
jgi:outer membrane protein OmpA-like peptidoglycan-associated protein